MNTKLDSKMTLSVLLGFLCVLLIVLTFFSLNSTFKINDEIVAVSNLSEQYENNLGALRSIMSQEDEITNVMKSVQKKIPSEPEESSIIAFLNSICTDTSVLENITFQPRVIGVEVNEMPIQLAMSGDFAALTDILQKISQNDRYYKINNVNISAVDTDSVGNLNFTIDLSAYYLL